MKAIKVFWKQDVLFLSFLERRNPVSVKQPFENFLIISLGGLLKSEILAVS